MSDAICTCDSYTPQKVFRQEAEPEKEPAEEGEAVAGEDICLKFLGRGAFLPTLGDNADVLLAIFVHNGLVAQQRWCNAVHPCQSRI